MSTALIPWKDTAPYVLDRKTFRLIRELAKKLAVFKRTDWWLLMGESDGARGYPCNGPKIGLPELRAYRIGWVKARREA